MLSSVCVCVCVCVCVKFCFCIPVGKVIVTGGAQYVCDYVSQHLSAMMDSSSLDKDRDTFPLLYVVNLSTQNLYLARRAAEAHIHQFARSLLLDTFPGILHFS